MYPAHEVPDDVLELASLQAGAVSAQQLAHLAPNVRRALSRRWLGIAPGLYALSPPDWHTMVWAGVLRGGDTAVVGGLASAHLHGMTPDPPSEICIWIPPEHDKRGFAVGATKVRYRRAVRTGTGSPPRLRIEQTLIDVATTYDERQTVAIVARALALKRTTPQRVLDAMCARIRLPHRTVVKSLCRSEAEGIESVLEWLYMEQVQRPHDLPPLTRQVRPDRFSRLDAIYHDFALAVEVDGTRFHDVRRDLERDNHNVARHHISTLRYGWYDVTARPCATARQVGAALRRRGWNGATRPCPNC